MTLFRSRQGLTQPLVNRLQIGRPMWLINPPGFTLIELVISTAVILMVLSVSIPTFVNFQRKQDLLSGAQIVRDLILETQNYALAPRGGESSSTDKATGADLYRIVFITDTTGNQLARYQIDEQTNQNKSSPTWQTIRSGNLPQTIKYCAFSPTSLGSTDPTAEPLAGIHYSISQLGRIVRPNQGGALLVTIQQKNDIEQRQVSVQSETGRIDVGIAPNPVSCS